MTNQADPTGGWQVGDRVIYVPKYSFDATYHRGVIVAIEIDEDDPAGPTARFTVQAEPEFGFGRMRLALTALQSRW